MSFKNRHVISMKDFSRDEIDYVLDTAEKLEPIARGERNPGCWMGKLLLFFFLNQVQGQGSLLRLLPKGLEGRF